MLFKLLPYKISGALPSNVILLRPLLAEGFPVNASDAIFSNDAGIVTSFKIMHFIKAAPSTLLRVLGSLTETRFLQL